ncbi:MAG: hypothetical protein ACTSXL_01405 [Alphaproteobacteria bacterium]|nr:MAG: hypothetical protein B6I23_02315 [Rickettsiaceae bacterium 4572_127]
MAKNKNENKKYQKKSDFTKLFEKSTQLKKDSEARLREDPDKYKKENFQYIFSKEYIDFDDKEYGFDKLSFQEYFCKLVTYFDHLTQSSWKQIEDRIGRGSKKKPSNHSFTYEDIKCKKTRKRFFNKCGEQCSVLFQIALTNKIRIHGFKNGSIFYPIWYDPEHKLFQTGK